MKNHKYQILGILKWEYFILASRQQKADFLWRGLLAEDH
jgi:hypothetical protein